MTRQSVEVFLTVVRTGSISAAAQTLYITQPAVSRHIRELEQELDCTLLRRHKGVRRVELTDRGERFVDVAHRWLSLWQETQELSRETEGGQFCIASIGSVSTYLLPGALRAFARARPECALTFHNCHSTEAYRYIDGGTADLALISDDMYVKGVETVPAFQEPMVLVSGGLPELPRTVHPSLLDPRLEIRLPWNPEYDLWHGFWFSAAARPRVVLNQMSLLEDAFSWGEGWAVVPLSAARGIARRQRVTVHRLEDGPSERIIYCLQGRRRKPELAGAFLSCLRQALSAYPEIRCFLQEDGF